MTREEAIKCLKTIEILKFKDSSKTYFFEDVKKSIDMAVEALEKEKEYIKNDDCISRQEFLKRIRPYNTSDPHDRALYNFAFNKMMQCASVKAESEDKECR